MKKLKSNRRTLTKVSEEEVGAGSVPFDTGLDYLKSKYPDEDPKHLEEEYSKGFGDIDYDPDFRKKLTKNLKE